MSISDATKKHIGEIAGHAIASVDPYASVKRILGRSGDNLLVHTPKGTKRYLLKAYKNVWIAGCGKAGAPMAAAIEEALSDRISGGIVVVKQGHAGQWKLDRITLVESGHPEPAQAGMDACRDVIELLKKATARNLVIAPLSGGGSALWPQPPAGISLEDKCALTRQILACGADIHEMNAVRKHISLVKGGRAAQYAQPADVLVLALSDVVGDEIDTIASGPFAPDSSSFADALQVIRKYGLAGTAPQSVLDYLSQGAAGVIEDTPGRADEAFRKVTHVLCATNKIALEAAADKAHMLGYETIMLPGPLTGECRDAARDFCLHLRSLHQAARPKPRCVLCGGETTVTLGDTRGKGGRNQEFALASAFVIEEMENVVVASFSTDGNDGPTDAAGAMSDCSTLNRIRGADFDPQAVLDGHNAYPVFEKLGDLIKTGPTSTNVMDIQIGIINV